MVWHNELTELVVTETIHERKALMADGRCGGCIARWQRNAGGAAQILIWNSYLATIPHLAQRGPLLRSLLAFFDKMFRNVSCDDFRRMWLEAIHLRR